jgi:hypothetical protein
MCKPIEVFGPEHEFSVVDNDLGALPIVDRIMKDFRGRIVNFVVQSNFTFARVLIFEGRLGLDVDNRLHFYK